ncbi:MAG: hypothetical protein IKE76_13865 [Clostridia bacterium]|nr:hypothetical protein [Clostridia bacterium]
MENRRRRRLTLPIHALYVACQYLGACAVCLGYPGVGDCARLWPGGPAMSRPAIMLWPLALLTVDLLLDRAWLGAYGLDLAEGAGHGRGLHRRTLEALAAPVLFILDVVAILAVLASQRDNAVNDPMVHLHTAAMAAGIALWIYGRALPRIRYKSVWGLRTAAAMRSVRAWGAVHLKAMPGACLCGALCLVAGTFLSPVPALCTAAALLVVAFLYMFTRK